MGHKRYFDAYFFQTICNLPIVYCGVTIKQTITDVQEWNVPSFNVQRTAHADNSPRLHIYARTTVSVYTAPHPCFRLNGVLSSSFSKALSFIFSLRCMLVCLWLNIM